MGLQVRGSQAPAISNNCHTHTKKNENRLKCFVFLLRDTWLCEFQWGHCLRGSSWVVVSRMQGATLSEPQKSSDAPWSLLYLSSNAFH
uniref:Uncharacterized protein n=1 Tax=Anguilla anguilla TaxID=7936 RepID=A0A0E9TW72_ANGAN